MDFEIIYKRFFPDVYRYSYSLTKNEIEAEEIAQETFVKALNSIDRYDGSKDIRAWLFTIAKNTFISIYRKRKQDSAFELVPEEVADNSRDIVEIIMDDEEAMRIHHSIHGLPEPYREIFLLRIFGELSFAQIGEIFGKGDSWARVTFFRAKKMILEQMEDNKYGE